MISGGLVCLLSVRRRVTTTLSCPGRGRLWIVPSVCFLPCTPLRRVLVVSSSSN